MPNSLKSQSILPRIEGIQKDVSKLRDLAELSGAEFALEDNFIKSQFYLRRVLEGVFHIGSHILSRLPGGRAVEYKEIALKLGELKVVELGFAQEKLVLMAGYRNRLTHFYADVTPDEIQQILKNHLVDVDVFLQQVNNFLQHLEQFGLTIR